MDFQTELNNILAKYPVLGEYDALLVLETAGILMSLGADPVALALKLQDSSALAWHPKEQVRFHKAVLKYLLQVKVKSDTLSPELLK